MKKKVKDSINSVPRKYRELVTKYNNSKTYQEKFMIDKGLTGRSGRGKKLAKQLEILEDFAIDKMQ